MGVGSLYNGGTEAKLIILDKYEKSLLLTFFLDVLNTSKDLLRRLWYRDRGKIRFSAAYIYASDWWRAFFYTVNGFRRRNLYIFLGLPGATTAIPQSPYFYYPLHHRPESSTLTLGRGLTDELAISVILKLLPHGTVLAVKENPMIVDDRRRSFYRWLVSNSGVVFLDPSVSTQSLIANSLGVISISGTALLEAGLFGKPAHAIGKPEFYKYLSSVGLDSLEDFMIRCAYGIQDNCSDSIERYVEKVFVKGRGLKLGWEGLKDKSLVRDTARNISEMLQCEIEKIQLGTHI